MSIKDFADKFFQAEIDFWEKGNLDALDPLEDPNVVFHMPSQDHLGRDKQALLRMKQNVINMRVELKYLTGEGNLFAASWKLRFVQARENPNIPATIDKVGKEGTIESLMLFRLDNGRIVEVWDWPTPRVYT